MGHREEQAATGERRNQVGRGLIYWKEEGTSVERKGPQV